MLEKLTIDDILFIKTCDQYPWQWDAVKDGKQVAYIRLRGGRLAVYVPDIINGELLYEEFLINHAMGSVEPIEEEIRILTKLATKIKEYYDDNDKPREIPTQS